MATSHMRFRAMTLVRREGPRPKSPVAGTSRGVMGELAQLGVLEQRHPLPARRFLTCGVSLMRQVNNWQSQLVHPV